MRLAPFSYFCICWNVRPTASPSPDYITQFLSTTDGLTLTKAFMQIKSPALRRSLVRLVEELAGDEG
jgi:hypothetical protein